MSKFAWSHSALKDNQSQAVPSTLLMGCSKRSKRALLSPKKFILGPAQGYASATVSGLWLETAGFCANCHQSFSAIIFFCLLQVNFQTEV